MIQYFSTLQDNSCCESALVNLKAGMSIVRERRIVLRNGYCKLQTVHIFFYLNSNHCGLKYGLQTVEIIWSWFHDCSELNIVENICLLFIAIINNKTTQHEIASKAFGVRNSMDSMRMVWDWRLINTIAIKEKDAKQNKNQNNVSAVDASRLVYLKIKFLFASFLNIFWFPFLFSLLFCLL